jgi:hypothetical protein
MKGQEIIELNRLIDLTILRILQHYVPYTPKYMVCARSSMDVCYLGEP